MQVHNKKRVSALIAIEVKYLGPTNHKPARWVATTQNGHRLVSSYNDGDGPADNAAHVAMQLADQLGWKGDWYMGSTKQGYTMVLSSSGSYCGCITEPTGG